MGYQIDDLNALPERYRKQAMAQMEEQQRNRAAREAVRIVQNTEKKTGQTPARKMHNKPTERQMPNGKIRKFDSRKEAGRYDELAMLLKAGTIRDLKIQPQFTLKESYVTAEGERSAAVRYIADFSYTRYDAERNEWVLVVEDVKSEHTRKNKDYRIKAKMMQEIMGITVQEVL